VLERGRRDLQELPAQRTRQSDVPHGSVQRAEPYELPAPERRDGGLHEHSLAELRHGLLSKFGDVDLDGDRIEWRGLSCGAGGVEDRILRRGWRCPLTPKSAPLSVSSVAGSTPPRASPTPGVKVSPVMPSRSTTANAIKSSCNRPRGSRRSWARSATWSSR